MNLHGAKILVTGASGFIGGRLVERLALETGAEIRALTRTIKTATRIAHLPVEIVVGDLLNKEQLRKAVAGCDIVINCASKLEQGRKPEQTTTFLSVKRVAEACSAAKVERMVQISSAAVYGFQERPAITESDIYQPRFKQDTYAIAKIRGEEFLKQFCRDGRLLSAILQPTIVYGPHSAEWTVAPIAMLNKAHIAMPEDDTSICNLIYVDDLVSAIIIATTRCTQKAKSYLICGGEAESWTQFLERTSRMGTLGSVERMSRQRLSALIADEQRQRGSMKLLIKAFKDNRNALRQLGEVPLVANCYNSLPKPVAEFAKKCLLGSQPIDNAIGAQQVSDLPLRGPTPQYLRHAGYRMKFSGVLAREELSFAPQVDLERGFTLAKQWAQWFRLLSPPKSTSTKVHDISDAGALQQDNSLR